MNYFLSSPGVSGMFVPQGETDVHWSGSWWCGERFD